MQHDKAITGVADRISRMEVPARPPRPRAQGTAAEVAAPVWHCPMGICIPPPPNN